MPKTIQCLHKVCGFYKVVSCGDILRCVVQFQRFNLRQSFLHCLHQQLLKSADRRSKNQNVNFSGDTQYLGLHVTALLTFHDFVDCKVNVQRSVVNYMAGAMRSLSARCVKESRASCT